MLKIYQRLRGDDVENVVMFDLSYEDLNIILAAFSAEENEFFLDSDPRDARRDSLEKVFMQARDDMDRLRPESMATGPNGDYVVGCLK